MGSSVPLPIPFGPMEATREAILAYSTGINETDPVHTDPSRGDFRAHPMYCARAIINATGAVLFSPQLDIRVERIVHAGIEIAFGAPILIGDRLSVVSDVRRIEEKGHGSRLIHIGYRVVNGAGAEVANGVTRYFERGEKPATSGDSGTPASPTARAARRPPDAVRTMPTRKDQSLIYADGPADRFMIHTDDAFARSVGLPGMILHGMCTLALGARAVSAEACKGDGRRLASIACRFSGFVLPGQSLDVRLWHEPDGAIGFEVVTDDGRVAIADGHAGVRA